MKASILNKVFKSKIFRACFSLVFWLGVWQIAATKVGQELLLPAPFVVLKRLLELSQTLEFWRSVATSMLRICAGFIFGAIIGAFLAVVSYFSKIAGAILTPALRVVRSTPVQSFIILALLWISYSLIPVFISMLMVIPVVWGNVRAGIENVDDELLEVTRLYKFSFFKTLKTLYLPSVLPYFFSGCVTALGMAWKSGIAAEVICLPKGAIGTYLYYSKIYLETPDLFAWTAVVIILSFLWERVFSRFFSLASGKFKGGEK